MLKVYLILKIEISTYTIYIRATYMPSELHIWSQTQMFSQMARFSQAHRNFKTMLEPYF